MKNDVKRIYVEKKAGYNVEAVNLLSDIRQNLGLDNITSLRILHRYDISGMTADEYSRARTLIFSEPPVDNVYDEEYAFDDSDTVFAVEFLPGQFDQRAASAEECVSILTCGERPLIRYAKIYVLSGNITEKQLDSVKKYCINPVEAREAKLEKPQTLDADIPAVEDVKTIDNFNTMDINALSEFCGKMGFAMDVDDLAFCQNYFKNIEKRNPTVTELRMIDTYWSDHCRHTTFLTKINDVTIQNGKYSKVIENVYSMYTDAKKSLYSGDRDTCLMNIAVIAAKQLKKAGLLKNLDESEEINACSIKVDVDIDGKTEPWLIMFKNETHNHPTEIEPFGGAATCLGGAIRDPLSGRSYVYQAMRVTGSGDPRQSLKDTLPGKLMQRKITTGAAAGYSSYGNQIGLATGQVCEVYHPGYVAKRMEIGAVIAAAPEENVIRMRPQPSDVVILLGGKTGRDGCGGATGSSKAHTDESIHTAGSEVQKGNPPVERKLQRLFRNPAATSLIKRCNDFGAGGVSVAIGELADGLVIDLDKVPKKYEGLDGTELAISESQERMAVVVAKDDAEAFISLAKTENLDAVHVADVTAENRLVMTWRGKTICDISRDFLNTNGVTKNTNVNVLMPDDNDYYFKKSTPDNIKDAWLNTLSDLNVCSQKGLSERFDASIGAGSVLMPFGGKKQLTPTEGMAAKVPVLKGETNTATIMTFGYNPYISSWSPFHGSIYAVVESFSKAVCMGADYNDIYLTFQEYFEKLGTDASRWGKPFASLLGAYLAQIKLGAAAIGGKDSMSGSFNELDVPPTLTSFAVAPAKADKIISNEFKNINSKVVMLKLLRDDNDLPDFDDLKEKYELVHTLIQNGSVLSASTVKGGGIPEVISKMCFGSLDMGFVFDSKITKDDIFEKCYGSIILELKNNVENDKFITLGKTICTPAIFALDAIIPMNEMLDAWTAPLEKVFPTKAEAAYTDKIETFSYNNTAVIASSQKFAKPRVFIPVFPGTNCEYDTARAFERAGAVCDVFVFKNLTASDVDYSMREMQKRIDNSQIIMIPGGFSGGDEPEGSGKFIATAFRNPLVADSVMKLLNARDGLMLGICNGFQALIKLGLVPYGEIRDLNSASPTLTFNNIGRHISCMANTKIASNKSPWLYATQVGDIHSIALSHGEGRFVGTVDEIEKLAQNGQIATQYVDFFGNATYDIQGNPNGSMFAIEGITSPDGRVLGKMGHSERIGKNVVVNVPGNKDQQIFESGVKYFK